MIMLAVHCLMEMPQDMIVGRATCIIRTNMVDMVTLCSLHPSKVHTPRIYKYPAAASSITIARLINIMAKISFVVLCALVAVFIQAQMSMAVPAAYGQ